MVGNADSPRPGSPPASASPTPSPPVPAEERNLQTHVPASLKQVLRLHVATEGTLLTDLYQAAIEEFTRYRAEVLGRGADVPYRASPRGSIKLNVRVPAPSATAVEKIAEHDNIPVRRVLFTAIVRYAEAHRLVARPD